MLSTFPRQATTTLGGTWQGRRPSLFLLQLLLLLLLLVPVPIKQQPQRPRRLSRRRIQQAVRMVSSRRRASLPVRMPRTARTPRPRRPPHTRSQRRPRLMPRMEVIRVMARRKGQKGRLARRRLNQAMTIMTTMPAPRRLLRPNRPPQRKRTRLRPAPTPRPPMRWQNSYQSGTSFLRRLGRQSVVSLRMFYSRWVRQWLRRS
mmetsp:Transcript_16344/g.32889  ORF Transcript_16344/g.32889 Transcript_16344/m.32889 type:complete len:203 (-) Transcript_16344:1140-1748(-)